MTTISYDRPVKDLISGLDDTGHVTHTKHRKTMVTLHHNGGALSHEGVLNVWRTRPASAHFDVDAAGAVAQYVRADEYAWACGDTLGNQTSISIEMCNQSGAPGWSVGDATWRSAARLAGWLFAHVIGVRPSSGNLVRHKYWSATDCAGPFIDQVYGQILQIAQQTYDAITSGSPGGGGGEQDMFNDNGKDRPALGEVWETVVGERGADGKPMIQRHLDFVVEELTRRFDEKIDAIGTPVLTDENIAAIRTGLADAIADRLAERLKD